MGVAVGVYYQTSLDAALHVVSGPLYFASVSLELEVVLSSFAALEPKHAAVLADEHHTGTGLDLFTRETADSSFRH